MVEYKYHFAAELEKILGNDFKLHLRNNTEHQHKLNWPKREQGEKGKCYQKRIPGEFSKDSLLSYANGSTKVSKRHLCFLIRLHLNAPWVEMVLNRCNCTNKIFHMDTSFIYILHVYVPDSTLPNFFNLFFNLFLWLSAIKRFTDKALMATFL